VTLRITASTTQASPYGLSPIFDLNTGLDATVVLDATISYPSIPSGTCAPLGEHFHYEIAFTQPFLFVGGGNLLLDFQIFSVSGSPGEVISTNPSNLIVANLVAGIASVAPDPLAFAGLPMGPVPVTLFHLANSFPSASVVAYGTGCQQSNGIIPQIINSTLPRSGSWVVCGIPPFGVGLTNAIPQTVAILLLSFAPASIPINGLPGCTILVDPALLYGMYFLPTSGIGEAQQNFAIPNNENLIGENVYFQWAVIDGGIGLPLPFALTAGLQATIGI
jgi:hypothetical protein